MRREEIEVFSRIAVALESLVRILENHPTMLATARDDGVFPATESLPVDERLSHEAPEEEEGGDDAYLESFWEDDMPCDEENDAVVDEDYMDAQWEIWREMDADADNYYRSEEEGWFYDDE
jgi:hypothetical protein